MKDKDVPDEFYAPIFTYEAFTVIKFSAYTVTFFITSLSMGKIMAKVSRRILLRIGLITQVLAASAFIGL